MKLPKDLSIDTVMQAVRNDDNSGFCLYCGNHQHGVEPDAENYECEECGQPRVFGAEQILIMNV